MGDDILKGDRSEMAKIWQDWKKSEYSRMMGSIGLSILRSGLKNMHGESFGELGRAHKMIRRFAY
ncbi:hypothetical protein H5410_040640 [Solanum commersonii]|uniref:Uncharacterized protein n=1 Tax=Solanum commersonii TaxID=4109 RepID=A0A9J5XT45_SOLCO|nr:hypothetical protein H5410_040640 [Solanum commersonii]